MADRASITVAGYELALDRRYDPAANLWVKSLSDGRVRVGLDPLGAETTGDIVAISFAAVGSVVARGEPLATVEAAKFVGPLAAPLGGTLVGANEALANAPGAINSDPLGTWVVELADVDQGQLAELLCEREQIEAWFAEAVQRFRRQGAIAQ
jgi:glycine cleavage system H protein